MQESLGSRIKKSIKNGSVVYYIPFDIWKEFLNKYVDAKSLTRLGETSSAFKELVESIYRSNVRIAWECRKEDQIPLARKFILACAENGNPEAMFHLGFALTYGGGWGFQQHDKQGRKWLRQSVKLGNISALACYPYDWEPGCDVDYVREPNPMDDIDEIHNKIMSSNDNFAKGWWCFFADNDIDSEDSVYLYFKNSAEGDNNEYGIYYLGFCLDEGIGHARSYDCIALYKKSAMMGFAKAQRKYTETLRDQSKYSKYDRDMIKCCDYFLRLAANQCYKK